MRPLPVPELSRAILIGAGSFVDLEPLPAVLRNLDDLAAALSDEETGILPRDRITVIGDPESPGRLMRELRAAARQAEAFFLVYYAGHGIRDQRRDDRLYLAVQETESDGLDGTAVAFDSVRDVIEDSMAGTRVLILDCCYSGMAVGRMAGTVVDAQEVAIRGTAVMTSSPPNSSSHAPPGDRNTAFTGELITLLRNGSRVPDEPLTVDVVFRSLQRALADRGLPAPQQRLTQNASDILLSRAVNGTFPPIDRPLNPPRPWSPDPVRRPAPVGRLPRALAKRGAWMVAWAFLAIGLSEGFGALVGLRVKPSGGRYVADDRNTLIVGICIVAGCVLLLAVRAWLARRLGVPLPGASFAWVDRMSRRAASSVLGSASVAFAALAAVAPFMSAAAATTTPQDGSGLAANIGVAGIFGIIALASANQLRLRLRRDAPPGLGDAPVEPH